MDFEWDESKRRANTRKHGIDFLEAALIFEGEILEAIDDRDNYGEERLVALGLSGMSVLRVTYTVRGSKIRLISAQKASKHDQKRYFENI